VGCESGHARKQITYGSRRRQRQEPASQCSTQVPATSRSSTRTRSPERAEALLDFLLRATNETIRYVPGFVSASLHVNFDRTQVVNYAQWKSREANRGRARKSRRIQRRCRKPPAIQTPGAFTAKPTRRTRSCTPLKALRDARRPTLSWSFGPMSKGASSISTIKTLFVRFANSRENRDFAVGVSKHFQELRTGLRVA
jgi:hypothetical protein